MARCAAGLTDVAMLPAVLVLDSGMRLDAWRRLRPQTGDVALVQPHFSLERENVLCLLQMAATPFIPVASNVSVDGAYTC